MSDSSQPHGLQPTRGSSVHGIFQARVLEWGAIAFSMEIGALRLKYPMSLLLPVPWLSLVNGPSHLQGGWEGGKCVNIR